MSWRSAAGLCGHVSRRFGHCPVEVPPSVCWRYDVDRTQGRTRDGCLQNVGSTPGCNWNRHKGNKSEIIIFELVGSGEMRLGSSISNFRTRIKNRYPWSSVNHPYMNATNPHWWLVNIGSGHNLEPSGNELNQLWPSFVKPDKSLCHGPLTRYVKLRVARASGMPGTFSPTIDLKGNR